METWLMQGQSFCILLLMVVGAIDHRRRSLHIRIMSVAMIWDVILILQIELSRSAILKASHAVTNPMILNIHILMDYFVLTEHILTQITDLKKRKRK